MMKMMIMGVMASVMAMMLLPMMSQKLLANRGSAHLNPMESMLREQIDQKRLKQSKASKLRKASLGKASSREAQPRKALIKKASSRKTSPSKAPPPPYQVFMISGVGKKLTAQLIFSPLDARASQTRSKAKIIAREGAQLSFTSFSYQIDAITPSQVKLVYGKQNWVLPFINARSKRARSRR